MNWLIKTGPQTAIGATEAAEIVLSRVKYLAEHEGQCNERRLLGEAIEYGRLLVGWLRENEPRVERKDEGDRRGKPGPRSDG